MIKRLAISFLFMFLFCANSSTSFTEGPVVDVSFKINDVHEEESA